MLIAHSSFKVTRSAYGAGRSQDTKPTDSDVLTQSTPAYPTPFGGQSKVWVNREYGFSELSQKSEKILEKIIETLYLDPIVKE